MASALRFVQPSASLHQLPLSGPRSSRRCSSILPPASSHTIFHRRVTTAVGTRHRRSVDDSPAGDEPISFELAVFLFNNGDYYRCHDFLEELWYEAEEPTRTILHGILQCAVGFHHLFNQNHRGAMMELGEGLCKLRKIGFESGPFLRFEQEISEALEFVYQTQKELAACADDLCIAMDGSEVSYRLLGSFAAGQKLYKVDHSPEGLPCIIFTSSRHHVLDKFSMVKVPTLDASKEHLEAFQYRSK
ncbi:hypothetical protein IEQ34_012769 [Dendrobium chrysotoxum]|uniref:DUF309 domain-containing protein n=1 Tax=Dendrobium chrysotoxum TaxID=161865 RepID=A0AAV7G6K7_DENCH|nr:hypothetical protein IEQ34_012769 [Dendrobium chrysotoxum]